MSKVISYEFRMNNSTQHTVSHLECGHERVFEYGYRPADALCWVCPPEAAPQPHAGKLVSGLVYASYRAQRDTSPEVTPQRWGRLECFEEYTDLEARYQRELAARAEANECIAGIGTDATGENGFACGKKVVQGTNYCPLHVGEAERA